MIRVLTDQKSVGVPPVQWRVEGDRVVAMLAREAMTRADWTTHDYNVHFLISVANDGAIDRTIEIDVECDGFDALPEIAPLLYAAPAINGPWAEAALEARTDRKTGYAIRASVPAGSELHIANTLPRPLDTAETETRRLCDEAGGRLLEFGRSLDGRALLAADVGEEAATPVLVSSGFHPPEPDTLATLAILDWLATPAGREAAKGYRLVVVPMANPDGYARSTQGSNAAGINMYWHFARELPEKCPEVAALWALADNLRPRGYIDFHCYTLQMLKKPGPYLRPLRYYSDPALRRVAQQLHDRFAADPELTPVRGFPAFAPHTLGTMLARKYQTLTLAKYHLHLKQGVERSRAHGIEVLSRLLAALKDNSVAGPAVPRDSLDPTTAILEVWAGLVRPQLGLLRRGRFSEINLQRTGLVEP